MRGVYDVRRNHMTRFNAMIAVATLLVLPGRADAQRGGMGMGGMGAYGDVRFPVPELPGPELEGPLDPDKAVSVLTLNEEQKTRYAQAYDSFMVATRPTRDSTRTQLGIMRQKLEGGDRAAATFYAERAVRFSRQLEDRQEKWEDQLSRFISSEQVRAYRKWKKENDAAHEEKVRESALDWQPGPGGFDIYGSRGGGGAEPRTAINPGSAVGGMEGVSQAVRVGRAVYVSGQVALDSAGQIVGPGDLKAQASKAFSNLTAVLRAGRAEPTDVVRLTVYVVNYKPEDLTTIRGAATAFFPGRYAPAMTVVGVQTLFREGLLIAVDAIAQATNPRAP
jgi:enamine deaminase RidA (YjgF/YER057c/UK114 family)